VLEKEEKNRREGERVGEYAVLIQYSKPRKRGKRSGGDMSLPKKKRG